jgi:hypothetical protein
MKALIALSAVLLHSLAMAENATALALPDTKFVVPPLSSFENIRQDMGPFFSDPTSGFGKTQRTLARTPKLISRMPVIEPAGSVDSHMPIKAPDQSIDYKLVVKVPEVESVK